MKKSIIFIMLLTFTLSACEKAYQETNSKSPNDLDSHLVTLRVTGFEQIPFGNYVQQTKATTSVSEICSRLNFAVFLGDEKVKAVSQTKTDQNFGTVELSLGNGTYQIVVLAHNCTGAATITLPTKITFPNNIVSDTFFYYGTLTVDGEAVSMDLELQRAVAMVRFIISDNIPQNVTQMKFYYTGGSSTFDAKTGYGCVNSKQTVKFDIGADMRGKPAQFEVFTLPHDETGTLKLTVTALDANGATVEEQVFEDVNVRRNYITQYTGNFFSGSSSSSGQAFVLKANSEWQGQQEVSY